MSWSGQGALQDCINGQRSFSDTEHLEGSTWVEQE